MMMGGEEEIENEDSCQKKNTAKVRDTGQLYKR
jgi:hypothetical protein